MQLKRRVTTALVLVSVFLVLVFWLSTPWFALALAIVVLAGAMEWSALVKLDGGLRQLCWLLGFCIMLVVAWLYREQSTPFLLATGSIWWFVAFWRLSSSPAAPEPVWFRTLAGAMALIPAWAALVHLHQADVPLLIALFLVVWLADTGAYFCGRALGRRKLAPLISPGKTIEGAVGGIVSVAVFATVAALWVGLNLPCSVAWIAICITTALISVVGDLWESKMKRIVGVKDSGSLLPGHGGVLDRIDSVTAAAPVYVTGLHLVDSRLSVCGSIGVQI